MLPTCPVASHFASLKSSIEETIAHADVRRLLALAADPRVAEALGTTREDAAEQAASDVGAIVGEAGETAAVRHAAGPLAGRVGQANRANKTDQVLRVSGGVGTSRAAAEGDGDGAIPLDTARSSPWAIAVGTPSLYDEQAALHLLCGGAGGGSGGACGSDCDQSLRGGAPVEACLPLGGQGEEDAMRTSFSDIRDSLRDHATPPPRDAPTLVEPTARQRYYSAGRRPPARGGYPASISPVYASSWGVAARSTAGTRATRCTPQPWPPPTRPAPPPDAGAPATGREWGSEGGFAFDQLTAQHEALVRNAALLSTSGFVRTPVAPPLIASCAAGLGSARRVAPPSCPPQYSRAHGHWRSKGPSARPHCPRRSPG